MTNLDEAILRDIYERLAALERATHRLKDFDPRWLASRMTALERAAHPLYDVQVKTAADLDAHDVHVRWAGGPNDPVAVQAMVEDDRKKRERIKQLEREAKDWAACVAERQKALDAERERANQRTRELDAELMATRTVKELESDIARLKAQNEALAQDCNELSDTRAQLEKVCQERNEAKDGLAAARTENARLRSRIDTLHNDLTKTRRDCSAAIDKNREGEQARREPLLRKIEQLEADEQKSKDCITALQQRLAGSEATIQLKTSRIIEVETAQANLRKMHEAQTRRSQALESEVARKDDYLVMALTVNTKRADALRTAIQFAKSIREAYGAEKVISTCEEALK